MNISRHIVLLFLSLLNVLFLSACGGNESSQGGYIEPEFQDRQSMASIQHPQAEPTGRDILDGVLEAQNATISDLQKNALAARLQQLIDAGTDSNLQMAMVLAANPQIRETVAGSNIALVLANKVGEVKNGFVSDDQLLQLNTPLTELSGIANSYRYFQLNLEQSIEKLKISTSGGSGDVDLYVLHDNPPTLDNYDCSPFQFGNKEICEFTSPAPGAWHILLHGYSSYSGVILQAESLMIGEPVQISGMLQVSDGQYLDGTTPDPENPVITNNTSTTAQRVTVPSTIGGYADSVTDEWDVYRVSLNSTTTFLLSIADPEGADLDLYLTDLNAETIDSSLGTGGTEIITSDLVGDFLLWVRAFEGGSNYLLAVDINLASSDTLSTLQKNNNHLSLAMPVVEDEVLVKFRSLPQTQVPTLQQADINRNYDLHHRENLPGGAIRMGISQRIPYRMDAVMQSADSFPLRYATSQEAARATVLGAVKSLRRQADIDYAEPNYIVESYSIPNDPGYSNQWHYQLINLPQAWSLTTGSNEIVTAVIDTGVVYTHPDLSQRMLRDHNGAVAGYDFIRRLADPFDAGDRFNPWLKSSFHGTHVAGTIGAVSNNATGVAGVTWKGRIMPLRVLGQGGGTSADIAQAIRYAAGVANSSGIISPVTANIINLSLGPPNPDCAVSYWPLDNETESALRAAQAAGAIVVVAAGNDNCHVASPFSHFEGVINVGAVDRYRQRSYYSNYGSSIDLVAPGGDVRMNWNDGILSLMADDRYSPWQLIYEYSQGTSMAAPHVAGVLGLMLAVNPELTSDDINRLIAGIHSDPNAGPITRDLGATGYDNQFGHGLIDASLAVSVAQRIAAGSSAPPITDEPILSVSSSSLNFGAATTSLPLHLENIGTGQLIISDITVDAPWVDIDTSNLPSLTISINRTGLSEGNYLAALTIQSNGGNINVPVILSVYGSAVNGDIGTVYVLLVDTTNHDTVAWAITNRHIGYRFQLTDIQQGSYYLIAGTDRNADGYVCDAGEACGRYPEFGGVSAFEITNDMQVPGFLVNYWLGLTEQAGAGSADQPQIESVRLRDSSQYYKKKKLNPVPVD